jgi:hypothetical protein
MGQMGDKRTDQAGFDARFFLGLALYRVAERGGVAFESENERHYLAEQLRRGFPAELFTDWAEASIAEKPLFEAQAAISALHEMIDRQSRRRIQSGVFEEDLPRYFRQLYQHELRQFLPYKEGLTGGPRRWREEPSERSRTDSPEEEGLPRGCQGPIEEDGGFTLDVLGMLSGSQEVEADDREEEALERLKEGSLALHKELSLQQFTPAEHRALAAVYYALASGASWHSRRASAVLYRLSPADSRAFRRACKRFPCLRSLIFARDCREEPCARPHLKWACDAFSRVRQEMGKGNVRGNRGNTVGEGCFCVWQRRGSELDAESLRPV